MAVIYGTYTLYSIFYGYYYVMICPMYIRWILNDFTQVACLTGVVLSILYLYYEFNNAKTSEQIPTPKCTLQEDKGLSGEDSDSEIEEIEYEAEYLSNFELY
jgi:hypothetical protein